MVCGLEKLYSVCVRSFVLFWGVLFMVWVLSGMVGVVILGC